MSATNPARVLVIKLSAFGDFIIALGAMAAIRRHHPDAAITILTTKPFADLARQSGYANHVMIDERPRWNRPAAWMRLSALLRKGSFDRVYDLQNNDRTALYFRLFGARKPEWVGAAKGAAYYADEERAKQGRAWDRHAQMLALVGISDVRVDDLSWMTSDIAHFALPHPYVILVPGSAPSRPEKRWPAERYGELAILLAQKGYTPVVIGTQSEKIEAEKIVNLCPQSINLCGRTTFADIAGLARNASCAIGNDTGPMHLIAPVGCPALVLFSSASDPACHSPNGPRVFSIQRLDLSDLQTDAVMEKLSGINFL